MKKTILMIFTFYCLLSEILFSMNSQEVKVGLDVFLVNHLSKLEGKRVGIITNQTGIASSGEHIVDILSSIEGLSIVALYAPEHGIRGDLPDATKMASYVEKRTGIQVWSLYGEHLKPTQEMLEDVDVLIYDIQDVGARFYTFISTMGLAMEAASEYGKQFIVLDRP
ncbi:MAG: exo-beta-N-acetylmuramidase NamZ domain-containing protein, partial [Candidatus Aminicenantaceae bacterium]